ncbi:MAG TPA: cytochrome c oxidase subunit II [Candidatus Limnocylindrales bacterium]|nr:cytochrome c oxidase subunit II [Candidatus Limnocylindrales bacterium]
MSSRPGARPSSGTIFAGLIAVILLVAAAVWIVANGADIIQSFWPPEPVSAQGRAINDLYTIVFIIAAIIFFVVEGLIVWTVIRYRRRPGDDELPPQTHGHNLAEIVWTVIPTVIVIFLFFVSWQTLNTVEATAAQPDVRVRAHAGQFQWTFEYLAADAGPTDEPVFTVTAPMAPDGGLVVPAGQTTHLYLTSNDVIHAFYVPQFLFKRDVVPGIINQFDLTIEADDAGQVFRGQCAELCGTGHRIMTFDVTAMAPDAFRAWYDQKVVEAQQSPPPPPSGEPGGSGAPPPGGGPVIDLVAVNVAFEPEELSAPADTPFTIHLDNQDAGTPHDVDILDEGGAKVVDTKEFNGVAAQDYPIQALPAGTYRFECSIHPSIMNGTLTVQ